MPTTVAIRFPLGRYHATPWDRSVNEGAAEWPPSPWRLMRALVATWYTRWPGLPAEELDALLAAIGRPPTYLAPPARPGHTRHYLPDLDHRKGETGRTDLTLDPFLCVARSDQLLVQWDADLNAGQREVLAKLVELLPYLGRADSVCEARLLDQDPACDESWWHPGDLGDQRLRLLAPSLPISRAALEVTTVDVRRQRRTLPQGTQWITYVRAAPPRRERIRDQEPATVEAVRFAIASSAPLRSAYGILLADDLHRIVARELAAAGVDDDRRRDLLGTGGAMSAHSHAHWIPIAAGSHRGAAVESIVLWIPRKLRPAEAAGIVGLRYLSGHRRGGGDSGGYDIHGYPEVRLVFQAAGSIQQVAPELCGPSRRWRSLTPYLPVRHLKREPFGEFLAQDVHTELRYRDQFRDLAAPAVVPAETSDRMPDRWAQEFRRYRLAERLSRSRPGLGLRLDFGSEVAGPLLLGQLSHFGYGIFVPDAPG